MPVRGVESEPIGIPVETGCFSNRDHSVFVRVDGPGGGMSPALRPGAGSQRTGRPIRGKPVQAALRLHRAGLRGRESLHGSWRVLRSPRACEDPRVPVARSRPISRKDIEARELPGIHARDAFAPLHVFVCQCSLVRREKRIVVEGRREPVEGVSDGELPLNHARSCGGY